MHLNVIHHLLTGWLTRNPDVGFILLTFGLIGIALWLAALNSCISNETPMDTARRTWALVIVFLGPIGALAYFLIRRPQRLRELGW